MNNDYVHLFVLGIKSNRITHELSYIYKYTLKSIKLP